MSRTKRGSKTLNCDYEYWSKRVGNKGGGWGIGRSTKKETLSRERMQSKENLLKENTSEYSTNDYPNVLSYFERKGVLIDIVAEHPCNLDVIFDRISGKWLGYVGDFCLIHEEMFCEKCFIEENLNG